MNCPKAITAKTANLAREVICAIGEGCAPDGKGATEVATGRAGAGCGKGAGESVRKKERWAAEEPGIGRLFVASEV
jgi:hypothetical protein